MLKDNSKAPVPKLGAHISSAGGVFNVPKRGQDIGCTTIQMFTRNQTRWHSKPLSADEITKFHQAVEKTGIRPIVAHDSYLINLGSPENSKWKQSREAFDDEIRRAEELGIDYLVFHPGAHMNAGEAYGLGRISDALNLALDQTPEFRIQILIETTAGQGSALGYRFEHLAELIDKVEDKGRMGVCLDTCHVFAAGYELRSPEGYKQTIEDFDRIVGLEMLKVLHVNDSKKDFASRVDRHADIGEGYIGMPGFFNLLHDERLRRLPMILETPGPETQYTKNLGTLRRILSARKIPQQIL